MDESYLEWLRLLPGFSEEKARKVVERFPTFEHLRAATPEELASVEGLSPQDLEAVHRLTHDPRGRDPDGHLFLCPECGSFAGPASTECPFCGVSFAEEGEEDSVREIDAFLREEEAPALLCTGCGAVLAHDAQRCDVCGREYTRQEIALLPGVQPHLEEPTRFCPHCGAYQENGATECAICGFDRLRSPEPAANGRNGKGIAEGFLSRWQRVAEAPASTEMDRLGEQLDRYDQLLEVDSNLGKVWAKRGRVLAKMGRAADAAESLAKAAELDPAKDEEYRLEVLDILGARGDLAFLPPRWSQVRATAAPSAEDARLLDALHHYDALITHDPNLAVAWRTKGEILERLGRTGEARSCLDRADALEKREDELLKARVEGLQAVGFVSASPSAAGRTNGLPTGRVNGRTNGRTNGRVNGLSQGRVNGLTNGAVNGLGAGRGAINGLGGFANGRTNGLVNGNGFTNGRRGRYGPGRIPPQPHWARSLVGIAAVIALMVLVPILASVLSPAPGGYAPIAIDHNFGEWARYTAYANAPPANLNNPDVNILEVKMATDPANLYVYAKVQGLLFQAPWTNGTESLFVFVDEDGSAATGYPIGGMGADLLAVVTGWDGQIESTVRYVFNESGLARSNDFRRFVPAGTVDAAFLGSEFEARIAVDSDPATARVLVYGVDNKGDQDAMVGLIQPGRPTVLVAQSTVAPGILTNRTVPILSVTLSPMGGTSSVSSLTVSRRGDSADPVTVGVYQDPGTGVLGPQAPLLGSAVLNATRVTVPLNLTVSSPTSLWITAAWANMTPLRTFGLQVSGVAGNGTASLRPADTTLVYQVSAPSTPTVDGAFADWAGHAYGQDLLGDVVNPTNDLVYDSNVDLLATAVDLQANVTGYARVAGVMLGGQDIPVTILRPSPAPPQNTTPPPGPYVPEVGVDVVYAYFDSDNSSQTGIPYRVGNRTYGFDYAIAVKGRNGQVNSSALYEAGPNGTWRLLGPAAAALDSHRLEFAVNATLLNLRVGYQVVYVASDWQLQYDVALPSQNVSSLTLGTLIKPPPRPPKNGPVISIVKTVSAASAVPGQTLTYLIYFNNTGGPAKTVWINDTLPPGVTFLSASQAPSPGSAYGWVFTNIGPNSQNTLQVTVQVNGNGADGSSQVNTATVAYSDPHGDIVGTGTSSATFSYHRPNVQVAKTVSPANAVPGQTVTYTIYYNNTGSAAANVSITDTMPTGLVNITSSPAPTSLADQTYTWVFTNVAAGSHNSIRITAQVASPFNGTQLVNWAFLNYTSAYGYAFPGSSSQAIVAIPELSDFLFVIAVPALILGLRWWSRRTSGDEKKGVSG